MPAVAVNTEADLFRLCRVIMSLLPDGDVGACASAVLDQWPYANNLMYVPCSARTPAMCFFQVGDTSVLCGYGVSQSVQLATVFSEASVLAAVGNLGHTDVAFLTYARSMISLATEAGVDRTAKIVFAGHSFGGAAAAVAAALWSAYVSGAGVSWASFGAPKVGDAQLAKYCNLIPHTRVMNRGDPVPTLPPTPAQAPLAYLLSPPSVPLALSQYSQVGVGTVIDDLTGNTYAAVYPPGTGNLDDAAYLGGFLGAGLYFPAPHWIMSYVASMRRCGWPAPLPAIKSTTRVVAIKASTAVSVRPLRVTVLTDFGVAPVATYIPPQYQVKMFALGSNPKVYTVNWMGQQICKSASQSNGKTVARNFNRLLRRMLNDTTVVNVAAMQAALTAWLNAAASGTSGIEPTLTIE